MRKRFLVVDDELHQTLRTLTYSTPLVVQIQDRKAVSADYEMGGDYLSNIMSAYKFLNLGEKQKESLIKRQDFLDITRIDPRCFGTSRLRFTHHGPSMLSAELLIFGTGALRRKWDNTGDLWHRAMKNFGEIDSKHLKVHKLIPTAYFDDYSTENAPENYESTNMIYGDTYGELQQIFARAKDIKFTQRLVHAFKRINSGNLHSFYKVSREYTPNEHVIRAHIESQKGLWPWPQIPPRTRDELITRVKYILDNSEIDSNPSTIVEKREMVYEDSQRIW